jgi:hypothetical protein
MLKLHAQRSSHARERTHKASHSPLPPCDQYQCHVFFQPAAYVFHAANSDERDEWIGLVKENVAVLKPVEAAPAAAAGGDGAATAGSPPAAAPPAAAAATTTTTTVQFTDPIEIGYWKIRGLAAPLRMMCVYAQYPHAEFPVFEVEAKDDGKGGVMWDRSLWLDVAKPELAKINPLINLPFLHNKRTGQIISQSR